MDILATCSHTCSSTVACPRQRSTDLLSFTDLHGRLSVFLARLGLHDSDPCCTCVWWYIGLVTAAMPSAEWFFRSVAVILAAHITSSANTIRRKILTVGIHNSKIYRLHQNQTSEIFQQPRCHLKTLAARMKIGTNNGQFFHESTSLFLQRSISDIIYLGCYVTV